SEVGGFIVPEVQLKKIGAGFQLCPLRMPGPTTSVSGEEGNPGRSTELVAQGWPWSMPQHAEIAASVPVPVAVPIRRSRKSSTACGGYPGAIWVEAVRNKASVLVPAPE